MDLNWKILKEMPKDEALQAYCDEYATAAKWGDDNDCKIVEKQIDGVTYLCFEKNLAPTQEEINQARIAELKQKLAETDYVVIKIAEGSATEEDYADIIAQRKAWRAEINELEANNA